MKILSAAIQDKLAQRYGTEPVIIIKVQWVQDGQWHVYADKEIVGYEYHIAGKIQELSDLSAIVKLDPSGQSSGVAVILDDVDGTLKDIFDNNDIHGRPVTINQWYVDLPLSEMFQLYEGEVTSEVVWNEGDRTLSFDVVSKLADKEAGFSPEEGFFPYIPEQLMGVPWPLCFGTVQNVPGVALQEIPATQTSQDLGITDPSLAESILKVAKTISSLSQMLQYYLLAMAQAKFTADYGDTAEIRQAAASVYTRLYSAQTSIAHNIANAKVELLKSIQVKAEQDAIQNTTLGILNSSGFPQGTQVIVTINEEVTLSGVIDGDNINITSAIPDAYTRDFAEPFGYTFIPAGATIRILSDAPVRYVCSITESTVHHVQTYKDQILVTVPTNLYTVVTKTSGPYTFTFIDFVVPLSSSDSAYSDDVFVTLTSDVGPNTVDIIQWLVETYTDWVVDASSFTTVRAQIDNYPSHFALLDRTNILTLIEEIAFQARCSVWLANGIVYIKYLAAEDTSVSTFTEGDIDVGSISVKVTNTEEIVTKFVAKWTDDYAETKKKQLILRHNVAKYGTRERVFDFYIYNMQELVLKSATFWLIRYANVWKFLQFNVHLNKLGVETFDTVTFNFVQNFIASVDVTGIIREVEYDSANRLIKILAWLPVKAGEMLQYNFSRPAAISVTEQFPTNQEVAEGYAGGAGPGVGVEGGEDFGISLAARSASGLRYRKSYTDTGERFQRKDWGNKAPTDINDIKPTPTFIGSQFTTGDSPVYDYTYGVYEPVLTPIEDIAVVKISDVFPGRVLSGSGSSYQVNIYPEGLSGPATTVAATQIYIDVTGEIPEGTGVIVVLRRFDFVYDGDGKITDYSEEYSIQAPVWL